MNYIAKRSFVSPETGRMVRTGDSVRLRKKFADQLIAKNLVYPKYKTKEDKNAMRVDKPVYTIKHDAGPMFHVLKDGEVIDRLKKSEAQSLADKLNT